MTKTSPPLGNEGPPIENVDVVDVAVLFAFEVSRCLSKFFHVDVGANQ